jgi:hypothetical protein
MQTTRVPGFARPRSTTIEAKCDDLPERRPPGRFVAGGLISGAKQKGGLQSEFGHAASSRAGSTERKVVVLLLVVILRELPRWPWHQVQSTACSAYDEVVKAQAVVLANPQKNEVV